jgi:hypothetical protein
MMHSFRAVAAAGTLLLAARTVVGGPPFLTDDPEPVDLHHGEFYMSSQVARDDGGWSGTAPHAEGNYGVLPDLQAHLIVPLAFTAPKYGTAHTGLGDVETGLKYRFLSEAETRPQVGVFPLVEWPTGSHDRGLGSGGAQVFLPVWLQKSVGPWTTYGGGGYGIHSGEGHRDWWAAGWLVQRHLTASWTLGAELYRETAREVGGEATTRLNVGNIVDLGDSSHLLLSAGPAVEGPSGFQAYVGFLYAFGAGKPAAKR